VRFLSKKNLLILVTLLTLSISSSLEAANGPQVSVVGTKGAATLPVNGDAQSAYRMPSSIGWAINSRLDFDFFVAITQSTLENTQNDYEDVGTTPGGSGGVIFALGRPDIDAEPKAWEKYSPADKWTLHTGVFIELAGGGGEADVRSTTFPETKGTGTGITFLTTAFTVAYTPTEWLSIGVAFNLIYTSLDIKALAGGSDTTLNGSPQIGGVPLPGNPSYADFLNLFSSGGDSDPTTFLETNLTSFQFTGVFSVSIRPNDTFGFGISYKPRSYALDFEGDATVDASRTFGSALDGLSAPIQQLFLGTLPNGGNGGFASDYDIKVTKLKVPRQIRGSFAVWPTDKLMFALEVAWVEWHRAFKTVEVELTGGQNTDVNFVVGKSAIDSTLKLRYSNRWLFAFQGAYQIHPDFIGRFGASYGKSPINVDRQGNGPTAGFAETSINLGGGYNITRNLQFNFLAEIGVPNEKKGDGSDETLTGKFSRYSSTQYFFHFGISYKF
jgi:long-subunit fatty acid transport protein